MGRKYTLGPKSKIAMLEALVMTVTSKLGGMAGG